MDETTLLIIAGLGLLALIGTLIMLRRSWGEFPSRGPQPPAESAPGSVLQDSGWTETEELVDETGSTLFGPVGENNRVPVLHPLARRAAEQALQRDPTTPYIVREGSSLYFDLNAIDDPAERQAALDLIDRIRQGQSFHVGEVLQLLRRLSGG